MPDPAEEEPEMSEQVAERVEAEVQRHVRVWFGQHVIASYVAEPELARRYAAAMARRFAGLRVTNQPLPLRADPRQQPLPNERLWDIDPH